MRNDDPMADNLLWRLFSYSPRSGRNPLEDYCTEALVWCLRKSAVFRRNFLALIKLPEVETYTGDFEFHTQSSYSQKFYAEEDEDDETASWDRGRFDVLILPKDFSFVIVIEVKVEADFKKLSSNRDTDKNPEKTTISRWKHSMVRGPKIACNDGNRWRLDRRGFYYQELR